MARQEPQEKLEQQGMIMALSDKDIARICTRLEIPIIASDLMAQGRFLEADEEYTLHQALSDMKPDAALLCIALTAEKILSHMTADLPEVANLVMEADRILTIHGPLWLYQSQNENVVSEAFIVQALESMPGDFNAMRDLIAELEIQGILAGPAAQIMSILQIQACAHKLIAETALEALGKTVTVPKGQTLHFPLDGSANDNITAGLSC
jgi:hypothetical protein